MRNYATFEWKSYHPPQREAESNMSSQPLAFYFSFGSKNSISGEDVAFTESKRQKESSELMTEAPKEAIVRM